MTTQQDTEREELARTVRITQLFAAMPFGGMGTFRYPDQHANGWTLDLIEHNLAALKATLLEVAEVHEANRERLDEYNRLFRSLGEVARMVTDAAKPTTTTHTAPRIIEAVCGRCGETFNPADETDVEHVAREDGTPCGGIGTIRGEWLAR